MKSFIQSLQRPENETLIEAVLEGYNAIFETTSESTTENKERVLTIEPGIKLFHGTGEDFDVKDVRPGEYDSVFWTTKSSTIAQSYIPVSGLSLITYSESVLKPDSEFLEQLGIKPFTDITKKRNEISSYKINDPYLIEVGNKKRELSHNLMDAEKNIKELEKNYKEYAKEKEKEVRIEMRQKIYDAYTEYEKIEREYQDFNEKKLLNDYVNEKLEKIGYEPLDVSKYSHNHTWRLKITSDNKILPANFREKGRLFVVTPKRQMKIYDIAGDTEPDLTDKQYHYVGIFNKLREKGYDGVRINDFAQHEKLGNVGHTSIGFFKHAIPDLDIKVIEDVSHPEGEELPMHTKEYENWAGKMESFGNFIKSIQRPENETLIEAILTGYNAIFETFDNPNKIKNELIRMGANVEGGYVTLYRGGNVSSEILKNLRYGDFLSTVKTGNDAYGNAGASGYGKNVISIKLPISDIIISNGEIQYKGTSNSLHGSIKYPIKIYKAYNDYYGSNYTAKEIDKQDNVRIVASMGLPGGREEFDDLLKQHMKMEKSLTESIGPVYHGTNDKFEKFDLDKTTMGDIWFSSNKEIIERGDSGACGTKYIMERYLNIPEEKLAGWDLYEKRGLCELRNMGYRGVKLPSEEGIDYIVFNPKDIIKKPKNIMESIGPVYHGSPNKFEKKNLK